MYEAAKQQMGSSSVNDVEDVEDWTEPLSTAAGLGIAEAVRMAAKSNEEEGGPKVTVDLREKKVFSAIYSVCYYFSLFF